MEKRSVDDERRITRSPNIRNGSRRRHAYGRLLSHLLNITTQALDVGAPTPILWAFEERENTPCGLWVQSDWYWCCL
jgi:hypothetical protein